MHGEAWYTDSPRAWLALYLSSLRDGRSEHEYARHGEQDEVVPHDKEVTAPISRFGARVREDGVEDGRDEGNKDENHVDDADAVPRGLTSGV